MKAIENAEGMFQRADVLRDYFRRNPGLNAQREEALSKGEPFAFDMPAELAAQLDKTTQRDNT
jgi:hypothetical protein